MFQCCFFVFLVFYDPFFPIRRMLTHPLIASLRLLFAVDFLEPGSRRQVILDMLPESPVRKGLKPLAVLTLLLNTPTCPEGVALPKVGALNHVLQGAARKVLHCFSRLVRLNDCLPDHAVRVGRSVERRDLVAIFVSPQATKFH